MVQYIYEPAYPWFKLRKERKGEFESELTTPPNPDEWFKVQITIKENEVVVYINGDSDPVMKVERLVSTSSGKIGLWVGNGSSGRFRNLSISQ